MQFMFWLPLAIGIGTGLGAFFVWLCGWNRPVGTRGDGSRRGLVKPDKQLQFHDKLNGKLDEYEREQRSWRKSGKL